MLITYTHFASINSFNFAFISRLIRAFPPVEAGRAIRSYCTVLMRGLP